MIEIRNLSKRFCVYRDRKAVLKHAFGFAKLGSDYDVVDSLKNINLSIPKHEVHGIVGMNGAGKSTLLKILSGVLDPSEGNCTIDGRVAALLELGTGFHSELTGRDNIFLNGALMGIAKADMQRKVEEIREFSELDEFFDRPVKIYSSGMYVRLAFAFAISVDPDVLIVDEALAVGDVYFQQKCLKKIEDFKKNGTTILLVTHDIGAVKRLCSRVTVLSRGESVFTGDPIAALDLYNGLLSEHKHTDRSKSLVRKAAENSFSNQHSYGSLEAEVTDVVMLDQKGRETFAFISGEESTIEITVHVREDGIENPTCGFLIRDRLGYDVFGTNTYHLGIQTGAWKKGDVMTLRFKQTMNLGPGDYSLSLALHTGPDHIGKNYHWVDRAIVFKVLACNRFQFIGVSRLVPDFSLATSASS